MAVTKRRYRYFDFISCDYAPMFTASTGTIAAVNKDLTNHATINGKYLEMTAKANNYSAAPCVVPTANGWVMPTPASAQYDNTQITGGILAGQAASFVVGTDAFFVRAKIKIATLAKATGFAVGFRTLAAYASTGAPTAAAMGVAYNECAWIGQLDDTGAGLGTVQTLTRPSAGAATLTALAHAALATTNVVDFKVMVAANKAVTYTIDGAADANAVAFSFTGTPTVVPSLVQIITAGAAGDSLVQELEWGLL